jgi:hypothetical protein
MVLGVSEIERSSLQVTIDFGRKYDERPYRPVNFIQTPRSTDLIGPLHEAGMICKVHAVLRTRFQQRDLQVEDTTC